MIKEIQSLFSLVRSLLDLFDSQSTPDERTVSSVADNFQIVLVRVGFLILLLV